MKIKDSIGLYFIALIPEEPVYSELNLFKQEFNDRFESKAALRSPPHLTLHMPFKWKTHKEEILAKTLDSISNQFQDFNLLLKNFSAFAPRVIYVDVEESTILSELQSNVAKRAASEWHIYSTRDGRPFNPHITIAFRDLKKSQFLNAWKEFESRSYSAEMKVHSVVLLKHNGKSWDIHKRFPLN